jgi:hypothetical protein
MTSYRIEPLPLEDTALENTALENTALEPGVLQLVTLSGRLERGELLGLVDALEALAQVQPSLRLLVDESEVEVSLIGPLDIRSIAQAWAGATTLKQIRVAVYAPSPVVYGLNRMVQAFGNAQGKIAIFRDRAAALAWLVEPPA